MENYEGKITHGFFKDENPIESLGIEVIKETKPIEESEGKIFTELKEIEKYVESSLIKACKILYEKNIRTISSSANEKDIKYAKPETGARAYIIIDGETLSKENEEIIKNIKENFHDDFEVEEIDEDHEEKRGAIQIFIPVNKEVSVEKRAIELANMFVKQVGEQELSWIPRYTIEELKKLYGIKEDEEGYNDPKVWEEEGYYYGINEKGEKLFYLSKEHFDKCNETL